MSLTALPATLQPALNDREAISDAIYRCIVAFDTDDKDLFLSAFTPDAVFELNGETMTGLDEILAGSFEKISKMDTTHLVTNMRINVSEEGSKAELTCTALAQHYFHGEGLNPKAASLLAGSLYWVELVKVEEGGLWKIKHWKLKMAWAQGDWSVFGK